MPREVTLGGERYEIARGKAQELLWETGKRPSQPGDPGGFDFAEWRVDGSDFNSIEDTRNGRGYLGRDYGENTDGRWLGVDTLGPAITAVALTAFDPPERDGSIPGTDTFIPGVSLIPGAPPSVDTAIAADTILGPGGALYAYIARGTTPGKLNLTTMVAERSGLELPAPATSVLATRSQSGARELSIGLQVAPYRVNTGVMVGDSDTWVVNDDLEVAEMLGQAPDRVVKAAGTTIKGNIMTGAVTMASPNWQTVSEIVEDVLAFTGFAIDDGLWVIGTSNGPYMLDALTGVFFPLIREIDTDELNCRAMTTWFPMGVVIPLAAGLRFQRHAQGSSFGPEMFPLNSSPVQGRPTAAAGNLRWLYTNVYNPTTGDTWLVAWGPRVNGDPHDRPWSPHVLHRFTAAESRFLLHIGTANGERTNPTLIGGSGSGAFYVTEGRTAREIDDENYRFNLTGKTYLTETRREQGVIKDFEAFEFETEDCDPLLRTVQVGLQVDGGEWNDLDGRTDNADGGPLNGVVSTDGFHRLALVDDAGVPHSWASGRRVKPRIIYSAATAAVAPKLIGTLRLFYRTRPETVRTFKFTLKVRDGGAGDITAKELEEILLDKLGDGPIEVREDHDHDRYFVRVESVSVREAARPSDDRDSNSGLMKYADCVATEWQTK